MNSKLGQHSDLLAETERRLCALPTVMAATVRLEFGLDRKSVHTPEEYAAYILGLKEIGAWLTEKLGTDRGIPVIIFWDGVRELH